MASIPQISARCAALALALAGCLTSGCVSTGGLVANDAKHKEVPVQLGVIWKHEVAFAPDPVHNGTPSPGLVGRVYLFGQEMGFPLEGDGGLHVELADGSMNPPAVLEQWDLDPETLRKFQRKDMVGPGYSIFLPWSTYRPEVTHVIMKVAYKPKQGAPLYASPASVSLTGGDMNPMTSHVSTSPTPPTLPMPSMVK
jgi:hypothetical protein